MTETDWKRTERSFIGISVFLVVILVVILGYSLAFLSKSLVHAFSSPGEGSVQALSFDFDGFKALDLKQ